MSHSVQGQYHEKSTDKDNWHHKKWQLINRRRLPETRYKNSKLKKSSRGSKIIPSDHHRMVRYSGKLFLGCLCRPSRTSKSAMKRIRTRDQMEYEMAHWEDEYRLMKDGTYYSPDYEESDDERNLDFEPCDRIQSEDEEWELLSESSSTADNSDVAHGNSINSPMRMITAAELVNWDLLDYELVHERQRPLIR